jgi:hypothetical protein
MTNDKFDKFLARALKYRPHEAQENEAISERVFRRLAGSLPPQKTSFWHWPSVLLDGQFSIAWPRIAALACCAAIGFGIGLAGLERPFGQTYSVSSVANRDFSSLLFEPEPLTGARP